MNEFSNLVSLVIAGQIVALAILSVSWSLAYIARDLIRGVARGGGS